MSLYEPTSWLGAVITGMNNLTGDPFLTYIILFIILATMMLLLFKIEFQWVTISLSGIILTLLAYSGDWLPFFGLLAILFGIMIARYFIGGD